jgi:hypothetical protein
MTLSLLESSLSSLCSSAISSLNHGHSVRAKEYMKEAVELVSNHEPCEKHINYVKVLRVKMLLNRAYILRKLKELYEAFDDAEEAVGCLVQLRETNFSCDLLFNQSGACLAAIHRELGNIEVAQEIEKCAEKNAIENQQAPIDVETASEETDKFPDAPLVKPENDVFTTPRYSLSSNTRVRRSIFLHHAMEGSQNSKNKAVSEDFSGPRTTSRKTLNKQASMLVIDRKDKKRPTVFDEYLESSRDERNSMYMNDQKILLEKFRQRAFSFHCDMEHRSDQELYTLKLFCSGVSHQLRLKSLNGLNRDLKIADLKPAEELRTLKNSML